MARSGTFRSDGKLLAAGCDDGVVKVFDITSKSVLRVFTGHKGPVHHVDFSADKVHVVSCSDDKTVKLFDVPTGSCVSTVHGHTDYVRTGCCVSATSNLWATGSFDHTVKLWDLRASGGSSAGAGAGAGADGSLAGAGGPASGLVMTLDHGRPVTQVLALPGGGTVVTAGGNVVNVWSVLSGGKLVHTFSNHQKTITSLCLDGSKTRLMSGALDGHVKVYDLQTFGMVYGMKYPSPVLSMACSPDNSRVAVGMADSILSIKQQASKSEDTLGEQRSLAAMSGGSFRFFMRGKSSHALEDDFQVSSGSKAKLKPYETFLKKFQYQAALDAALETRDPVVVVSLMEELRLRDGLNIALDGRDETTLELLVAFVAKHITHPRYSAQLIGIADRVFDLYAPLLGRSIAIDRLFLRLQFRIQQEIKLGKQLRALQGGLDLVMAAASMTDPK